MGRALYRESSPSQDGDPVPGNLPFFFLIFFYVFLFVQFLSFPSLYVNQKLIWSVLVYTLFTSLHYTLTIGTSIEMLLNRNVIKSNNIFFEGNSSYGPNTQRSMEYLCTWSMQYVLLLFHIVLKFTLYSWQVPRSSVGRALYRESGPSQDGDPVPGNLPFFFFFLPFFFHFLRYSKVTQSLLEYPSFHFRKKANTVAQ